MQDGAAEARSSREPPSRPVGHQKLQPATRPNGARPAQAEGGEPPPRAPLPPALAPPSPPIPLPPLGESAEAAPRTLAAAALIAVPASAQGSAAAGPRIPGTAFPGVPRAAPALRAQDAPRPARCSARRMPADAAAPAGAPPGAGRAGASRRPARRHPPGRAGPRHSSQLRLPLPPPPGSAARLVRTGAGRAPLQPGTARGTGGCVSASSRPQRLGHRPGSRPAPPPCPGLAPAWEESLFIPGRSWDGTWQ